MMAGWVAEYRREGEVESVGTLAAEEEEMAGTGEVGPVNERVKHRTPGRRPNHQEFPCRIVNRTYWSLS